MIKAVATDVDGTLTLRRGDVRISYSAIKGVRLLESRGIKVILVSGNSLPVTAALKVYIGSSGPVVAENGCVVFHEGRTIHVCEGAVPEELRREVERMGFRPSWQNDYRFHDAAYYPPRGVSGNELEGLIEAVRRAASRYGVSVLWSGYALHLNTGSGKVAGLREAIRAIGVDASELAAIGDGENDLDMLGFAAVSACPADAAEAVRRSVDYVAKSPGGRGFLEFARAVLSGEVEGLKGKRSR